MIRQDSNLKVSESGLQRYTDWNSVNRDSIPELNLYIKNDNIFSIAAQIKIVRAQDTLCTLSCYATCKCFVGIADLSIFEYIMLFFKFIQANYKKEDSILSSTVTRINSIVQNTWKRIFSPLKQILIWILERKREKFIRKLKNFLN